MLRLTRLQVVRPLLAQRGRAQRNFVSAVLLTRTWENETVLSLRKEAKNRGLSSKGSKANLILRITEFDSKGKPEHIAEPTPANTRSASSSAGSLKDATRKTPSQTVAPGPGVSPAVATSAPPPEHSLFNVILPDLSQPDPEPPVEVPYVPDFWDSTAFEKPNEAQVLEDLPKMVVVGGVSTHHLGPTHHLETVVEAEDVGSTSEPVTATPSAAPKSPTETTVMEDISQDLGLPSPKELKQSLWKLFS